MIASFVFFWFWQAIAVIVSFVWQYNVTTCLIRSSACGFNNLLSGDLTYDSNNEVPYVSFRLRKTIEAETYVAQCYDNTSPACAVYAKPALSFEPFEGACPFARDDFCLGPSSNSTPFMLSSGPINSHTDLGINAAPSDRVTYQKNTTCSPLHSAQFGVVVWANETNEADVWPPDTKLQWYFYGPVGDSDVPWTFEYPDFGPDFGFPYDIT